MLDTAIESVLRRDGVIVASALILLVLLAWAVLLAGAGTGMDPFAMSGWLMPLALPPALSGEWTPFYWFAAFSMWVVMMVAMMLPSAAPIVLLYARVVRQPKAQARATNASACVAAFAAGYLLLWVLFSLLAVGAQWALEHLGALSPMMSFRASILAGGVLIAAGLYQLTPLKAACLKHCRSPAQFLAAHW